MTRLGRLLAIAAALHVTAGAATAAAQTVMVRNAPPGMTVEALLNDAVVATGTANPEGVATLDVKLPEPGEMDANIYVDVCDHCAGCSSSSQRALPPPAGCVRRESAASSGSRVNTLVVDIGATQPSMLLVKGGIHRRADGGGEARGEATGADRLRSSAAPASASSAISS
jgi:hypothetical protein